MVIGLLVQKKIILKIFLQYMGMVAILVMWLKENCIFLTNLL